MGQQNPRPIAPPMAMGQQGSQNQTLTPYQPPKQLAPVPYAPFTDMMASQMPAVASPNSLSTTNPTIQQPQRYSGGNPFAWGIKTAQMERY